MVSEVYVVGMGMGNPATLTVEARDALSRCELVIGSPRLLSSLDSVSARKVALVAAEAISQELHDAPEEVVCVVMSGEVGLYSGATRLYELIGDLNVHVIPGISSLAYLCARLHTTWQDAKVVSAHGREHDAVGAIQSHAKTFVLLGGNESAQDLCARLTERGLGDVRVTVGQNLSYENEHVVEGLASELAHGSFQKLAVMLVQNDRPLGPSPAPHLADDAFARGKVPMTKEEVRELAVCKLRVRPSDVVWDVGAGTGSVSVELARAAYAGQVFAVERGAEALDLVRKNRDSFGLYNLSVVEGEAPQALAGLPAPNCVFVGGTSGRLESILERVLASNPQARVCISAVTLETLADMLRCAEDLRLQDVEVVQVGVSRSRKVGSHHLMRAQNPVYLMTASCGRRDA